MRLLDRLAEFARPVLILTGGEPMVREDIYELARHAADLGLRVAMAPCGPLLTPPTVARLKGAGVGRISISIDGPDAETHDRFRGVPGAYDAALRGMRHAREAGLEFQINTTVTRLNAERLPEMLRLAENAGVATWDLFFLVPTGRGAEIRHLALDSGEYERTLLWVLGVQRTAGIPVKTTCAPHIVRLQRREQRSGHASAHEHGRPSGGCMAGRGFLFISHRGVVQPCGFLDVPCGDLREANFDVRHICETSSVLCSLGDTGGLRGKCGACEFRTACGGCRARAFAATGDYLESEPSCAYTPSGWRAS